MCLLLEDFLLIFIFPFYLLETMLAIVLPLFQLYVIKIQYLLPECATSTFVIMGIMGHTSSL